MSEREGESERKREKAIKNQFHWNIFNHKPPTLIYLVSSCQYQIIIFGFGNGFCDIWIFFNAFGMVGPFVLRCYWITIDRIDLNRILYGNNSMKRPFSPNLLLIRRHNIATYDFIIINIHHSLCCVLFTLPAAFISVILFASWQSSISLHFLLQFWWYIVLYTKLKTATFSLRRSVQCKCLMLTAHVCVTNRVN